MSTNTCAKCGTSNQAGARFCKACGHELPKPQPIITSFEPLAPSRNEMRRKNIIGVIVGVIGFPVILALGFFVYKGPFMDGWLAKNAMDMNRSCPIMIDEATRLDNVEALPGNTMQYNYTLVTLDRSEINTDAFIKGIEPSILNNVKTNQEMQFMKKMKTTLIYHYSDMNGEYVHQYTITPEMYSE